MSPDVTLSETAAEEILAMLARRRMSKSALARLLGVSHTWVTNRLSGDQEIGLNELQRIAEILDVDVTDLLPRESEGRVITTGRTGGPLNGRLARSPVRPIYRRRRPTTHPNGGPRPEPSRPVPAVAATQRRPMLASGPGQRITGRARAATV